MNPLPPPPPYTPAHLKQARNQQSSTLTNSSKHINRDKPILRPSRRTNPIIWSCAILCLLFSLLLIFFGITTLIIFIAVKPRNPTFDTPAASLSVIYFDSPQFFNGDITFLTNFTNPNKRLSVRFEYLNIELYFSDSLIATKVVQPFSQRAGEARLIQVHMLSSLVYLPPNLALQTLHGNCEVEMTSPPNGALIAHHCRIDFT